MFSLVSVNLSTEGRVVPYLFMGVGILYPLDTLTPPRDTLHSPLDTLQPRYLPCAPLPFEPQKWTVRILLECFLFDLTFRRILYVMFDIYKSRFQHVQTYYSWCSDDTGAAVDNHILTNHTTDGRPVNNPEDTINVTLEFFLSELISVVICIT